MERREPGGSGIAVAPPAFGGDTFGRMADRGRLFEVVESLDHVSMGASTPWMRSILDREARPRGPCRGSGLARHPAHA